MIYNLGCIYTYGKEAIDLAIYGFNIAPISRVRGESVAKAAAYILRANIADPYLGMTHYYAYGKDLLYSEIIIPDYAPRDFLDLTTLGRAATALERKGIQTEAGNWNRKIVAQLKQKEEDVRLRRQKRRERGHDRER